MKPSRLTAAMLCFHDQVTIAMAILVLYLITRIWVLARRGKSPGDPVLLAARDWRSQNIVCSGGRAVAGGDAVRPL
jgi:hypothetical protein